MSEQLANLYSTTLASNYTAGSGSITVTSATGAPSAGTFSLTLVNPGTGNVILIFRVTSVSGTTFSGAAEGTDANAAAGSIVLGTMLTVAAINQLFADHGGGGGGFIQTLTAPVHGNFTAQNFNVGASVVTTQTNNSSPVTSITLDQFDPSTTQNIVALDKAKLASTFTITLGFSSLLYGAQALAGLWLSDGGSPPNNLFWCVQNSGGGLTTRAPVFSNFTTFAGDAIGAAGNTLFGPLVWLRIQETASARNYSFSTDGINFAQVATESNTAHFTTSRYGFGCENRGSGGHATFTAYSFTETNP